jgi:rRNA processing protein Gar1
VAAKAAVVVRAAREAPPVDVVVDEVAEAVSAVEDVLAPKLYVLISC